LRIRANVIFDLTATGAVILRGGRGHWSCKVANMRYIRTQE